MPEVGSNEQIKPVKVVCLVGGVVNDHLSELEYLSRMMKMHYDWFLFYQKAQEALLEKNEVPKLDPTTTNITNIR